MTKEERERYKKLLLQKKKELIDAVRHIEEDTLNRSQREASGDLSGYTLHMADIATDSYDREFSLGLASNAQKILFEIDEALKRLKDNTFGDCLDCGKPIPKKRLNAIPYASLCIQCQSKSEVQRRKPEGPISHRE
jgi:RNA polymerase-binding protein DksA